jgi:raffinose/stachyose/melibiose transport system substrate-binding protein
VPLALQSGNPPDIFQQWGGGQEATQLKSGKLANLTSQVPDLIKQLGPAAQGWQVNGQQYGIPTTCTWWASACARTCSPRCRSAARPPPWTSSTRTWPSQGGPYRADRVGSKDRWPDAFYWDYFVVRECSVTQLQTAVKAISANYPCFVKATTT